MTDDQQFGEESRRSVKSDRAEFLSRTGLTVAEAALLNLTCRGQTLPPADFAARGTSKYCSLDSPLTEAECQATLDECLAKGWLRVIDESALAEITNDLSERGVIGPIYGLPDVGDVDFTRVGADMWLRRCEPPPPLTRGTPSTYTEVVREKTARFFRTRAAADAEIEELWGEEAVVGVSEPIPIGPWRVNWWRRLSEGYRVDVEARYHWMGMEITGETSWLPPRECSATRGRLIEVLDQHGVTMKEWCLLARLESGPMHLRSEWPMGKWGEHAGESYGVKASQDEWREAFEGCLRRGWLRVMDQGAVDEVSTLLRNDPAYLSLPNTVAEFLAEARLGPVDFSPAGAELYQTVSKEWLGSDWDISLHVCQTYYYEEHAYCESEDGFLSPWPAWIVVHRDDAVSTRLVPIGAWCVFWWEVFPSGYRLEREFGGP